MKTWASALIFTTLTTAFFNSHVVSADESKASAAPVAKVPPICDILLTRAGQLTSVVDLQKLLANMDIYMSEFRAHHDGKPSEPMILTTPESAKQLEATWGPIISTTTFSRELNDVEFREISMQLLGFLSGLPQGRAIIASGGTMGNRDTESATGGGVGIMQRSAMQLGFKTLSITSAKAFAYRAAPADYLLFSLGGFGSESRLMSELSKALVVVGGGNQAYNEAVEFLIYNPNGILVLIDDPLLGGSSTEILQDSRFAALAASHPNVVIAKTGSQAGHLLSQKLGLESDVVRSHELHDLGLNELNPNVDLHLLMPNSLVVGFSGWSNISAAGPDVAPRAAEVTGRTQKALERIHTVLAGLKKNIFYSTAGNDPTFTGVSTPAFETMVHNLSPSPNINYLAITAKTLAANELNSRVRAVMYVSNEWKDRTQQLVSRSDSFITAGGNAAVIDQTIQASLLKKHQLHILGANTLTDMRIEHEKINNPNLKTYTPEQILNMSDEEIKAALGL